MSGATSSSTELPAFHAEGFVQSICVNTHLGWWNTAWGVGGSQWAGAETEVLSELSYTGITDIRDGVPQSYDATEYTSLAKAGIHFDVIQTSNNGQITLGADVAAIAAFNASNPGSIVSYEGANEYNNNSYTLDGQNSLNNLGWGILDDQTMKQAVDASNQLADLKLFAASTSSSLISPIVGPYVTDSNWHVYAGVGQQLENNIAASAVAAEATAPGAPIIFTEAGVSSSALSSSSWGVAGSDEAQGIIDTNALLDAYKDGVQQTFLYDLMDDNQASDQEDNFGLFDADGTPKAAAIDVHDLTRILSDTGASADIFTTGTLKYALQDAPSTASSILLEKSNGAFDIALWNGNASLVNTTATAAITPPITDVTVQLGATYQNVEIFDPIQGATPIETINNISSVSVPLSADPLIIEVEPNPLTMTPATERIATTDAVSTKPFNGLVINDPNAGQTETAAVSISSGQNGGLTDPNAATDGSKTTNGVWALSGSAAQVAAALNSLVFTPQAHEVAPGSAVTTTFAATVTDSAGKAASASSTVTATAMASPLTMTPATERIATTDAVSTKPFNGLVINDPNAGQTETAAVSMSSGQNGGLTDPNAATDGSKTTNGVWALSGSAAQVAAALNSLVFTPQAHEVAPGSAVTTTFAATVTDSAGKATSASSTVTATAMASPPVVTTPIISTIPSDETFGSGPDSLILDFSEDSYLGNAQFIVSVDGTQIGGTQTATALKSAGQTQTFNVLGNFSPGNHQVNVDFLNDAYDGSATTDRNLYVNGATIDGSAVPSSTLSLMSAGTQSFSFNEPLASPDTLDLKLSEDAWQGDAQYTISINGTTIGGVGIATASHASGAMQNVSLTGSWGANPTIGITFTNDAYGGSSSTDRNLYVNSATYDSQALNGAPATLLSDGTSTLTSPPGSTALTLNLAEDAWNGDAQYSVSVDGKTLVQGGTVTALHSQAKSQVIDVQDVLSAGTHDVAVSFLNDAYGGTSTTDRNLYVTSLSVNGTSVSGATASLFSDGTQHFQIVVPTTH